MRARRVTAACILPALLASCGSGSAPPPSPSGVGPGWVEWGQNPQHSGHADVAGQNPDRVLAEVVYDPFVPQEQEASRGSLLVHYPAPLVDGDDVFLMSKGGAFSGLGSWSTQTWLQTRLHWRGGRLVDEGTFVTPW